MNTLWGVTQGVKQLRFRIQVFRVDLIMRLSCSMPPTETAAIQDRTQPKLSQLRFLLRRIRLKSKTDDLLHLEIVRFTLSIAKATPPTALQNTHTFSVSVP